MHFSVLIFQKIMNEVIFLAELKRTPLYPEYEKHGAKTVDFGGWEMAVQFSGIKNEHEAVRTKVGLFDVSHMGEAIVEGEDAAEFLQYMLTNNIKNAEPGKALYTAMCYEDGGTIDDLLVYQLEKEKYMLVLNAANIEKDLEWLGRQVTKNVSITNISEDTALIAVQGPMAETVLQKVTDASLAEILPFRFAAGASVGESGNIIISRTGYTGEDGFELYCPAGEAIRCWETIMEAGEAEGILPCGLGARDTLRFEAKLPLYGQELSADITPLEAGIGFCVKLKQEDDFIGKEALKTQKEAGLKRKLVGIEMVDKAIPRPGYRVQNDDGAEIGWITTGTQSPTLKSNVGLALLDIEWTNLDQAVEVDVRGKAKRAKVAAVPFYKREK